MSAGSCILKAARQDEGQDQKESAQNGADQATERREDHTLLRHDACHSISPATASPDCRGRAPCHSRRLRNPVLKAEAMTIDLTSAGPQQMLPGAEKASDA